MIVAVIRADFGRRILKSPLDVGHTASCGLHEECTAVEMFRHQGNKPPQSVGTPHTPEFELMSGRKMPENFRTGNPTAIRDFDPLQTRKWVICCSRSDLNLTPLTKCERLRWACRVRDHEITCLSVSTADESMPRRRMCETPRYQARVETINPSFESQSAKSHKVFIANALWNNLFLQAIFDGPNGLTKERRNFRDTVPSHWSSILRSRRSLWQKNRRSQSNTRMGST